MKRSKKITAILMALSMALSLAACGQKTVPTAEVMPPATQSPATKIDPQPEVNKDLEIKTGGSLVVYSSHKEDVFGPVIKEFQERTGIKVDVVAAGTGEILKRIEAESANPLGDVMFGGGVESLEAYKAYFEPYTAVGADKIGPTFLAADQTWTGFSALPMVIMYNTKLVSEAEAPTGWSDLIDPKWKGKIAFTDPALSGSCFTGMVTMLTAYNSQNEGWDFMKEFVTNLDGKLLKSSSDIFKGVADGEYSLGVTLEESAQKYVLAGSDVKFIYASEGTSAVPDGTAVLKGAVNMDNAKLFLDFTVSEDIQKMIVSDMSRRSVRTDVEPGEGLLPLGDIKLVDYDVSYVSTNKDAIMNKWKNILIGK